MPPPEQFSGGARTGPSPGFGTNIASGPPNADAMPVSDPMPAPGELHIKGKLTWKTWQVVVAVLAALLIGMGLNYRTVGATSASNAPAYKLPASGGAATTTTPSSSGSTHGTVAGGSTTTTAASGSTTTSTPSSPASTAAPAPAGGLLGPTQLQGNWTSPSFTTTVAGWNIGWAFRCAPAPASGPSFEVFVTKAGSTPSGTPAISQTGATGQSVTAQSTLGAQTLVVQAPASCTWAVKVTGS